MEVTSPVIPQAGVAAWALQEREERRQACLGRLLAVE